MERHCPRGQSPSRVVAPVKKKKKIQLWLLIRIYLLENEFTPILNKLKLCNMIQILAVAFFHSGTI
jgi:hypothetical protein